jgi:peptidoglycan hydrolase-like protein with peptidoglycan-binding domain
MVSSSISIPNPLATNSNLAAVATGGMLLRNGSKGPQVSFLQQALMGAGYWMPRTTRNGAHLADGVFGQETTLVVHHFQSAMGLMADAIVGPKTLGALDQLLVQRSVPHTLSALGYVKQLLPKRQAERAASRMFQDACASAKAVNAERQFIADTAPFDLMAWRMPDRPAPAVAALPNGIALSPAVLIPIIYPVLEEIIILTVGAIVVTIEIHRPPPPPVPPPIEIPPQLANHMKQALIAAQLLLMAELQELIKQIKEAAEWVRRKLEQCKARATHPDLQRCLAKISTLEFVLWSIVERIGSIGNLRHFQLRFVIEGLKSLRKDMQDALLAVAECLNCDLRRG